MSAISCRLCGFLVHCLEQSDCSSVRISSLCAYSFHSQESLSKHKTLAASSCKEIASDTPQPHL